MTTQQHDSDSYPVVTTARSSTFVEIAFDEGQTVPVATHDQPAGARVILETTDFDYTLVEVVDATSVKAIW